MFTRKERSFQREERALREGKGGSERVRENCYRERRKFVVGIIFLTGLVVGLTYMTASVHCISFAVLSRGLLDVY